jgi:hypothetical protein
VAILVALLAGEPEPDDPAPTPTQAERELAPPDQTSEPFVAPEAPEPIEPSEPPTDFTPGDENTPPQTELIVGDDGCTLTRGELPDEGELEPEWWFTDDEEGRDVFERDALSETSYRYPEPGRYRVALRVGNFGSDYQSLLSNRVTVDC